MLLFVFLTGCLLIVYLYYVLVTRAKKRKKLLNRVHKVLNILYATKNSIENVEDLSDIQFYVNRLESCINLIEVDIFDSERLANYYQEYMEALKEYESISAVKRIALAHARYCISKLEEYERTLNWYNMERNKNFAHFLQQIGYIPYELENILYLYQI